MTQSKLRLLTAAMAVTMLFTASSRSAFAADPEWYTDAAESTDGRFLFVSLSNRPLDLELKDEGLTGEDRDQIEHFRLYYPVSGMYLNDNSTTPLWKFNEPWRGQPVVAPDGEHVIFQGPWTSNEDDSHAVEFTRRGKSIRSYADGDFISTYWLKRLLNGGNAPSCKSTSFDPKAMAYTVATNQGEEYVFNVKNGNLLVIRSPFPMYYTIFGVVVAGLVFGPAYWMRRKQAQVKN